MAYKSLVITFLKEDVARAIVTLPGVKDIITEAEVLAAIIAQNIFYSSGGNLVSKHYRNG